MSKDEELRLYKELDLDYLMRSLNMTDCGDDELYINQYELLIKLKEEKK